MGFISKNLQKGHWNEVSYDCLGQSRSEGKNNIGSFYAPLFLGLGLDDSGIQTEWCSDVDKTGEFICRMYQNVKLFFKNQWIPDSPIELVENFKSIWWRWTNRRNEWKAFFEQQLASRHAKLGRQTMQNLCDFRKLNATVTDLWTLCTWILSWIQMIHIIYRFCDEWPQGHFEVCGFFQQLRKILIDVGFCRTLQRQNDGQGGKNKQALQMFTMDGWSAL